MNSHMILEVIRYVKPTAVLAAALFSAKSVLVENWNKVAD